MAKWNVGLEAPNLNLTGTFAGTARSVIVANNLDTSTGSAVNISYTAGTGAGATAGYFAPSYTPVPLFTDAFNIENLGAGGVVLSAYGGGGLSFCAGTGRSLKWSVDATGANVTNGSLTVNCISGTDVFVVNQPGSTPAGSYIQLTSPGAIPGIIGNYGGAYRTDLRFNSGGSFSIGVGNSNSSPSTFFNFTSAGDLDVPGTVSVTAANLEVGFRQVPITAQNGTYTFVKDDAGKCRSKTNTTAYTYTVNNSIFAAGDVITVTNFGASANITLAQGSGVTLRLAGTATTGNRTVAPFGVATIFFQSASVALVSGAGVS